MRIWAGTRDGIREALSRDGLTDVDLILHGAFDRSAVERWCGIEAPPEWATVVIYDPPIEADGSAIWREYRHPFGGAGRIAAPDCDVIFARIKS